MRTRRLLGPVLALPLIATGCGTYEVSTGRAPSTPTETVSAWTVVGTWEVVDEPGEPVVRFGQDGEVVGHDGCNIFSGERWTLTEQGIRITGDRLSSMMLCLDGSGAWLTDVAGYRVDGAELRAVELDGSVAATLRPAAD